MRVQSHRGPYRARFGRLFEGLEEGLAPNEHLIIDAKVADLYRKELAGALKGPSVLRIEATEVNKSLDKFPAYMTHLLERGIRRDHVLIAVGGGVVQDITSFIAATLLRGLPWRFYPTTLLAQADSCIGSKSSINVGAYKNQLGTFTPPDEIVISLDALKTLSASDLRSGIGEMIKVHILSGWEDARELSRLHSRLESDPEVLSRALRRSLEIKKRLIELDEFDKKERLILNYGHTFGHAIESATDYSVPHGIAVTMGVDLANRYSVRLGYLREEARRELQPMIERNLTGFERVPVPLDRFLSALSRDKKNAGKQVRFVLLREPGAAFLEGRPLDDDFRAFCSDYFARS